MFGWYKPSEIITIIKMDQQPFIQSFFLSKNEGKT